MIAIFALRCSQLIKIGWHFVNLGVVMVLNVLEETGILGEHEVNRSSLSSESTSSTDSVDVVLLLDWQLVVDDKTDLLHIDTSGKQVSGDQHANGTLSELLHDNVSLDLVHLTVHDGHDEVLLGHALLKLLDTLLSVAVDEGLVDVQIGVEVQEDLDLPFFLFDGDVVLVDTFKGELLVLDEDLCWLSHEMLGQSENIRGQRG